MSLDFQVSRDAGGLHIRREWHRSSGWALLLWVAAGAYGAAAHFLNRTDIDVTRAGIAVRHGPLPWYARRPVPRSGVAALKIEVQRVHTKGGTLELCRIWLRGPDGARAPLLAGPGLSTLELQALASEIARHVGVPVET